MFNTGKILSCWIKLHENKNDQGASERAEEFYISAIASELMYQIHLILSKYDTEDAYLMMAKMFAINAHERTIRVCMTGPYINRKWPIAPCLVPMVKWPIGPAAMFAIWLFASLSACWLRCRSCLHTAPGQHHRVQSLICCADMTMCWQCTAVKYYIRECIYNMLDERQERNGSHSSRQALARPDVSHTLICVPLVYSGLDWALSSIKRLYTRILVYITHISSAVFHSWLTGTSSLPVHWRFS